MSMTEIPCGMKAEPFDPNLMQKQVRALTRIADALEALVALQIEDRESYDTGDTPPNVDLAGRPIGAVRGP